MLKAGLRLALTVAFATFIALLIQAPVRGRSIKDWLFAVPYDRTPNAVRIRFNSLADTWAGEGRLSAWKEPPTAGSNTRVEGNSYLFYQQNADEPIITGPLKMNVRGTCGDDGKVSGLTIDIAPTNQADNDYLTGCDQCIQIAVLSLFDVLNEQQQRSVQLAMLYDLRPYNLSGIDSPLERQVSTVIGGEIADLKWSVQRDGTMSFGITLSGPASGDQVKSARDNDSCNNLLSQANDECSSILNSLYEMRDLLNAEPMDWAGLGVYADLTSDFIALLLVPMQDLTCYSKTEAYLAELTARRNNLLTQMPLVHGAIEARDRAALTGALNGAISEAWEARHLISVLRE